MRFITSSTTVFRDDYLDDTKPDFDEGKTRYIPSYSETARKNKDSKNKPLSSPRI